MPRKKIVFFIVEGPSDREAIELLLNRLYPRDTVVVEVLFGDITTDRFVTPGNIVSKIGNLVKDYANKNHYKVSDFREVVHLLDTDGAFISDNCIKEDPVAVKFLYSETEIRTAHRNLAIERNRKKRANISRICFLGMVWNTIPYKAYYMSANLDHVLYNILNSSDQEKDKNSHLFARKYKDDIDGFLEFISDSSFSVNGEFKESWEFIKVGCHSLERHTNFGLCFKQIREERNN